MFKGDRHLVLLCNRSWHGLCITRHPNLGKRASSATVTHGEEAEANVCQGLGRRAWAREGENSPAFLGLYLDLNPEESGI